MQSDSAIYYAHVFGALGAEFQGIQHGPRGALILFADPHSRSTLAIAQSEFTAEAVMQRIYESRAAQGRA